MTSLVIIAKDDLVAFQYGRRRDKHRWRKVICVGKFCQEIAKFCFLSEKAKVIRGCNIYCGMVWILGSQFTCHIIVKVEVPLSPLNPENPVNPVPEIPRDSGLVKSRIPATGFGIWPIPNPAGFWRQDFRDFRDSGGSLKLPILL